MAKKNLNANTSFRNASFLYPFILVGLLFLFGTFGQTLRRSNEISYSEFQSLLTKYAISKMTIGERTITGTIKSQSIDAAPKAFSTIRVDPAIAAELGKHNVKVTALVEVIKSHGHWVTTVEADWG